MFEVRHSGDFKNFERFAKNVQNGRMFKSLDTIAKQGVYALASHTPVRSGLTAASWDYEIVISNGECGITWINRNINNGFSVAIGLQYGHGTGTGGWVSGYDYINPAIQPIMDKIAEQVWRVVTSA